MSPDLPQKKSFPQVLETQFRSSFCISAYCQYLGKSWHERAYTSGLIHDIGKFARYKLDEEDNEKDFIKDSQLALDKKINFHKAELINDSPKHDYLGI